MTPYRVLLVDHHRIVRDSLAHVLSRRDDMQVVGHADNGRTAIELAQQLRPDVVIIEVNIPQVDGREATRQIVATCPETRVIGLSVNDDDFSAAEMLQAGAQVYLSKFESLQALYSAIRQER
jgi:DNA-binding NarL/FixJ family response regulator